MQKLSHRTQSFDEFTLDLTRGCLLHGQKELKLRPKAFEVLSYLVENSGRLVDKDELIHAVWVDTAVTDDSLVQCLMEVRRALGDERQQIIKTVPRRGYIFDREVSENRATEQPRVFTEETTGVRVIIEEAEDCRTGDAETRGRGDEIAARGQMRVRSLIDVTRRHKVVAAVSSVILAALVVTGIIFYRPLWAWWFKPPSIAILPIVNATGDPNNDYISDGWTESLITSLAQLNERGKTRLRVTPQSTVFVFKDKEPLSVGRQLGVDTVLASRMFDQNNLRIFRFELINVADGAIAWAKQYSIGINKNDELLAKQNVIPRDIALQLPLRLSDAERENLTCRYTQNPQAYDAYLKGRAAFHQVTPTSLRKSIEYYQQAIDLDPNFAVAYWAMGVTYAVQAATGSRSNREAQEWATQLNQKALGIDSTLRVAASGLGDVGKWNWKAIQTAGRSHPGYSFPSGGYLIAAGRLDEQLEFEERRLSTEPHNPLGNFWHGNTLFLARRYDEAIAQYQKTLALSPDGRIYVGVGSPWIHWALGQAYIQKDMFTEAFAELNKCREVSEDAPVVWAAIGYAHAKSGQRDKAIEIVEQLQARINRGEYVPPLGIAGIYIGLGDKEQAFVWLDKAFDERATGLAEIKTNPIFDPLRSDPRLTALIRRMGLPA